MTDNRRQWPDLGPIKKCKTLSISGGRFRQRGPGKGGRLLHKGQKHSTRWQSLCEWFSNFASCCLVSCPVLSWYFVADIALLLLDTFLKKKSYISDFQNCCCCFLGFLEFLLHSNKTYSAHIVKLYEVFSSSNFSQIFFDGREERTTWRVLLLGKRTASQHSGLQLIARNTNTLCSIARNTTR